MEKVKDSTKVKDLVMDLRLATMKDSNSVIKMDSMMVTNLRKLKEINSETMTG